MKKIEDFQNTQKLIDEFEALHKVVPDLKEKNELRKKQVELRIERLEEQKQKMFEDSEFEIDLKELEKEIDNRIKKEKDDLQKEQKGIEKEESEIKEKIKYFRTDSNIKTITLEIMDMQKEISKYQIELKKVDAELAESFMQDNQDNSLKWKELYDKKDELNNNMGILNEKIQEYSKFKESLLSIELTPEEYKKLNEIDDKNKEKRQEQSQTIQNNSVEEVPPKEKKVEEKKEQYNGVTVSISGNNILCYSNTEPDFALETPIKGYKSLLKEAKKMFNKNNPVIIEPFFLNYAKKYFPKVYKDLIHQIKIGKGLDENFQKNVRYDMKGARDLGFRDRWQLRKIAKTAKKLNLTVDNEDQLKFTFKNDIIRAFKDLFKGNKKALPKQKGIARLEAPKGQTKTLEKTEKNNNLQTVVIKGGESDKIKTDQFGYRTEKNNDKKKSTAFNITFEGEHNNAKSQSQQKENDKDMSR